MTSDNELPVTDVRPGDGVYARGSKDWFKVLDIKLLPDGSLRFGFADGFGLYADPASTIPVRRAVAVTTDDAAIAAARQRLSELAFDVASIVENKHDTAVCTIPSTAVEYRNPHYEHERGWTIASEAARMLGDAVRKDIYTVLTALDALRADNARLTAENAELRAAFVENGGSDE